VLQAESNQVTTNKQRDVKQWQVMSHVRARWSS